MRLRRQLVALVAGTATAVAAAFVPAPNGLATVVGDSATVAAVACTAPAWAEGVTYQAGGRVTYLGRLYEALVTHTPPPGAGWNPVAAPSLWRDLGACD